MRFLVDENVSRTLAAELETLGHDVRRVGVEYPGASDRDLLAVAAADERLLVTQDWDFGHLVFGLGERSYGVIIVVLAQFAGSVRDRATEAAGRIDALGGEAVGYLTVLDGRSTRRRRLVEAGERHR